MTSVPPRLPFDIDIYSKALCMFAPFCITYLVYDEWRSALLVQRYSYTSAAAQA